MEQIALHLRGFQASNSGDTTYMQAYQTSNLLKLLRGDYQGAGLGTLRARSVPFGQGGYKASKHWYRLFDNHHEQHKQVSSYPFPFKAINSLIHHE